MIELQSTVSLSNPYNHENQNYLKSQSRPSHGVIHPPFMHPKSPNVCSEQSKRFKKTELGKHLQATIPGLLGSICVPYVFTVDYIWTIFPTPHLAPVRRNNC